MTRLSSNSLKCGTRKGGAPSHVLFLICGATGVVTHDVLILCLPAHLKPSLCARARTYTHT